MGKSLTSYFQNGNVVSLMDASTQKQYLSGTVVGVQFTQGFLLGAGVLMEISIAMVLLSRVLPTRANRLANIATGIITTAVQVGSLLMGQSTTYYWFFSIIEIGATASIVWIAHTWRSPRTAARTEPSFLAHEKE